MLHTLAMIVSAILVGFIGYNMKIIGSNMSIASVVFSRLIIGSLVVAAILPFVDKKAFQLTRKQTVHYALVGALMALTFSSYLYALVLAPVANVSLITSSSIIFTVIFALLFLKEKPTKHLFIATGIAIVGLWLMNTFAGGYLVGSLIALGQAVLYGILIGVFRMEEKHSKLGATFWFLIFAALFVLPFALITGFEGLTTYWFNISIIGVFGTGLTVLLLNYAVQKINADTAAIINLIGIPVSSILLATIFIREVPGLRTIIGGCVLLLAGAYLIFSHKIGEWHKLHAH